MSKLKNKLAVYILIFTAFLFILFLIFNKLYIEKKNQVHSLENRMYSLENSLLHSFNEVNTLLLKSLSDTGLLFAEQSYQLLQLRKFIPKLNEEVAALTPQLSFLPYKSVSEVRSVIESYQTYIAYLNEIIALLKSRSETNSGIISKINLIEVKLNNRICCDEETFDRLRLYSRSYMLYKNHEYIEKINWITNTIESEIKRKNITESEKLRMTSMLSNYNMLYSKLQQVDLLLDFRSPLSYVNKLINEKDKILNLFATTYLELHTYQASLAKIGLIFYSVLLIVLFMAALLFNRYVSKLVVNPITWLTNNIIQIIYDKHKKEEEPNIFNSFKEIDNLYKKILVLLQYLKDQEDKRQIAQKELRRSEQRYRELADMLPQSIYETDSLGNLVYVNRAWYKTFGFSVSDVEKGVNIIETIVSDTGEAVMGNKKFFHSDFTGIRKDGTTFSAIVYSNQIIRNGKMSGIRGIIIDNTERKKYIDLLQKEKEKAENLDKQKTSYLADMSHELRTPMNAILGFADLLSSLELSEKQKEEFVSHINQSSQHVLHLIDDIIDLAKIEAGELIVNKKDTEINHLLCNLSETYHDILIHSGKNKKLELILNIPTSPLVISTDVMRLNQVLNNLLSNALKYTEKGLIEFGYNLVNKAVKFYVKDTGIGISASDQEIIFGRFNHTEKTKPDSSKGLGLSISKKIIELLGGRIWVDSEPGNTCFYFTLPVVTSELSKPLIEIQQENEYLWKDKLILVAEDEDLNYKVLKEFISRTQAKVIRAYDGEEVVDLCSNNDKIDLVLMDIKMPRKNGYEATREIKKMKSSLPVIALTAYALTDEKEKCYAAGCDGYISKPFKKEFLLKTLHPFLSLPVNTSR